MSLQWPRAVAALVFATWCLGLLHAQVLDHIEGSLGGPEFAPSNSDGSATAQQPPHLILIVADDLGWNDVSWHNSEVLSPHLGQLATEGIILNRSYVQPICSPTRSALLASRYPFTLGRQNNVIRPMAPTGLSLDVSLLPEELHKLGYQTNMVGKWHLGFCKKEFTPTMRGFDNFFGYYNGAEDYYSHVLNESYKEVTRNTASGYDFRINMTVDREVAGTYSAFAFADRANSLLTERNPAQPLFLYLAFQSVHTPLQVPQNYSDLYNHIVDEKRRTYLGMVTAMDEAVGKVVASLKATGHYDNSVIVFTTDNGGPTSWGSDNSPLRGNKTSLWEGGTRGSAFIHSPLLSYPGTVSNRTIHVTDWFPTFLHLARGSPPAGIDGVNQWEVLNNSSLADARDYFVYDIDDTDGIRAAARWNQFKLILGDPGPWPTTRDKNKGRHFSINEGISGYKVADETNPEDIQKILMSVDEENVNLGVTRRTRESRGDQMRHSNKKNDVFVQEDDQHLNKLVSEKKRQQLKETREVTTDVGSTLRIEDFKSVSQLLNSEVKVQLYNVEDDPTEQDDITAAHSDVVELILKKLGNDFARYVAKDVPPDDAKADPSNFNSTWSPGWC